MVVVEVWNNSFYAADDEKRVRVRLRLRFKFRLGLWLGLRLELKLGSVFDTLNFFQFWYFLWLNL